jgi:uncharacterized membrane protein
MGQQLHNELKREFQLERLILFSDAVFAIAITLLVIELKIPEVHKDAAGKITDGALLHELGSMIGKFVGFIISFILIGLYWTIHHRMFGFVTSYNGKLLRLNLIFLFFIALMPFSTAFYSEYATALVRNQVRIPLVFYVMNFFCLGIMNYVMWRYISNQKHKLTEPPVDPVTLKLAKLRSLTVPLVFLTMLPVAYFVHSLLAMYMPMLIPVVIRIGRRSIYKKYGRPKESPGSPEATA